MGYTMRQIQSRYNSIVDDYKAMMFTEAPCSSIINYSLGGVYRSTDLKSVTKDSVLVRIKLISKREKLDKLNYPTYCIDIDTDQYIDGEIHNTAHYDRFYRIDDNYYTSNIEEVKHARSVSLKRYINFCNHRCKITHLNISKLSGSLIAYLRKAVDSVLDDHKETYVLKDVYFNYNGLDRKLVVVVKHNDKLATEAFSFDTKKMFD